MFPTATFPADANAEVAKAVFGLAQALFLPDAVVHLGAGTGQGPLHQWRQWQVPQSLVVDAQLSRMAWAKDWAAQSPGRHSKVVTIGVDGAKGGFKVASNPNESGLIDPENLTGLWSNLKRVESLAADCVGVDRLLSQTENGVFLKAKKLWLLVDFFCPDTFWAGSNDTLDKTAVLVVRQSKTALKGVESLASCNKRMEALGFMRVADLESNHPQVVHGVYLRNLATGLQQALAQRDQETKAKTELAGKLEEESKARTALQQEKTALQQEKNTLAQDKTALEKEKAALMQETAALEQQRAKITKEAATLKESIEVQTRETASIQLRCQDLESTNSDLQARQQLMHEELVKAEAQIELIKDLILRETGL